MYYYLIIPLFIKDSFLINGDYVVLNKLPGSPLDCKFSEPIFLNTLCVRDSFLPLFVPSSGLLGFLAGDYYCVVSCGESSLGLS